VTKRIHLPAILTMCAMSIVPTGSAGSALLACGIFMGTGSPPPNLDPVRNSHTLKRICIFVNLIMSGCRMPCTV